MATLGEPPAVSLVAARRLRDEARTTLQAGAVSQLHALLTQRRSAQRTGAIAFEWLGTLQPPPL
jgi:hypothetical protein